MAFIGKALMYSRNGNVETAKHWVLRALDIEPDHELAIDALHDIEEKGSID